MSDMIEKLQNVLDEATASGEECGCQLTIYRHGELLCDLVSGWTDQTKTRKVDINTLFPVFSVGKGVLSILYHLCTEEGIINSSDPVAKYWPEYACNGKEDTRIWHFLSHRSGSYTFPEGFLVYPDGGDWDKACNALAQAAPAMEIGGIHRYHGYTFGLLVGKVLENAARTPIRELLRKKLLDPLKIDTFFYGIPEEQLDNLALITPGERADGTIYQDDRVRMNEKVNICGLNPSSHGASNAHALAKIYASTFGSGVDGVRFLKDETLKNALTLCRSENDPAKAEQWDRFGLGLALIGPEEPWNRTYGHGGACGSEGFCDRETGYAVGFTKNKLTPKHPNHPLRNRISEILGIPKRIW